MDDQLGLFDQQRKHLERVSSKIEHAILFFCRQRGNGFDPFFRMDDLVRFVCQRVPNTAPDSPSRILRQLRRKGLVSYEVVNRRESLYRLERVA